MGHTTVEWVYVGAVVGILVWVGAIAWDTERIIHEVPEEAVTIKVTASQWFWTFEHPDGTKEVGTLTLQKGKAYNFDITSTDVVHAFNIPYYAVMVDAAPGRINHIWFSPDQAGEFLIQCREYCGLLHYQMRATLIVEA